MNTSVPNTLPVEVLIAEDSPTQAQRLKFILEQKGYQVRATKNGREALASARQQAPTIIISDVVMPEMDGYQLCHAVKAEPSLANVPVILVTTLSDPQDVIRGLECGADNFILKPYDEHYLLGRVEFVLANRDARSADQGENGVEIFFNGQKHSIKASRLQILNLLLSTYEAAIQRNKELSLAQSDLHRLNANLETANQELEAFSYSVSHDLRAPLRHIDGFAQLLMERFGPELSPDALRLLNKVTTNVKHMGHLIDDLLRFSRLSRQELLKRPVNVRGLVDEVIRELRDDPVNHRVEVKIGELPDCVGDRPLLKQVWVNLISNGFKFSRKQKQPVVEISCANDGTDNVYQVRDNGAGFNMEYSKKLFGVFQRLHSTSEFEGTGIGLSIVKRIVQRHGGRIWAEGEVDKGAKFSFTIPSATNK